mmetsp:Transcript_96788/g.242792  ORF Transcript_96788/g.242792 Transcript_96788/m.242792 type:complete len:298 (+) Transcript_96788:72-965(+)
MAIASELDVSVQGSLSEESSGKPFGEIIRDYEPMPDVQWRFGKPNYARVNKAYFEGRSKVHPEGSLESVVNKLVKNWEVESHHIADPKQWKTMDISKFKASLNGGACIDAQTMADVGPYNMLIGDTPTYAASELSFEQSNKIFGGTFSEGFAWEVLEVLSGPPTVAFKWRHFGKFSGTYTDRQGREHKGTGEMIDLIGMCIAQVNESLLIESLDIYYNPDDLLRPLTTGAQSKVAAALHAASDKGYVDLDGLKGIMRAVKPSFPEASAEKLFKAIDKDGCGKVKVEVLVQEIFGGAK